jgi:hypothetical protein
MRNAIALSLALSVLGGCGTTDFGDRLQSEGAEISLLGNRWEKGGAMVKRGNAMVEKGRKRVAEGGELIEDGEDLIRRGRELQADAESAYQKQN